LRHAPKVPVLCAPIHADGLCLALAQRSLDTAPALCLYSGSDPKTSGVRLKTSPWRRIPANSIFRRVPRTGAYVHSVFAPPGALTLAPMIDFWTPRGACVRTSGRQPLYCAGGVLIPQTRSALLEGIPRRAIIKETTTKSPHTGVSRARAQPSTSRNLHCDESFCCVVHRAFVVRHSVAEIGRPRN